MSCPQLQVIRFDPDPSNLQYMIRRLRANEHLYFDYMREKHNRKLTPSTFTEYVAEWDMSDWERIETYVLPQMKKKLGAVMNRVGGGCHTLKIPKMYVVRLNTDIENGFPFTLDRFIFMPTVPRHVENASNLRWLMKTYLHEGIHILQRHFPALFCKFYRQLGVARIRNFWLRYAWKLAWKNGFEPISNPDTYRAYLYGFPLDKSRRYLLFTNLAVDGPNYREMAFILDERYGTVSFQGWLDDAASTALKTIALPKETRHLFQQMKSLSEWEGHPHEIFSRVWENI